LGAKAKEVKKQLNTNRAKTAEVKRRIKPAEVKKASGIQIKRKNTLARAKNKWGNN
jgi:hypothetical protein